MCINWKKKANSAYCAHRNRENWEFFHEFHSRWVRLSTKASFFSNIFANRIWPAQKMPKMDHFSRFLSKNCQRISSSHFFQRNRPENFFLPRSLEKFPKEIHFLTSSRKIVQEKFFFFSTPGKLTSQIFIFRYHSKNC